MPDAESDTRFCVLLAVTTTAHGDKAAVEMARDLGFGDMATAAAAAADAPDKLRLVANDVVLLLSQ